MKKVLLIVFSVLVSSVMLSAQHKITQEHKDRAAEVSQVYVKDNESSLVRPEKELKGFNKTFLKPGDFTIFVGSSSADLRLSGTCNVK